MALIESIVDGAKNFSCVTRKAEDEGCSVKVIARDEDGRIVDE